MSFVSDDKLGADAWLHHFALSQYSSGIYDSISDIPFFSLLHNLISY